jgi:hypothetical protein
MEVNMPENYSQMFPMSQSLSFGGLAGSSAPQPATPMGTTPGQMSAALQQLSTSGASNQDVTSVLQNILSTFDANNGGAAKTGMGGMWSKMGGLEGLGNAAGIVGDLGGVYTALKGLGLAKDQLNFNKSSYNTNLANQTKTYNTELEGRTQAQYFTEGKTTAQADAYVKKNSL